MMKAFNQAGRVRQELGQVTGGSAAIRQSYLNIDPLANPD